MPLSLSDVPLDLQQSLARAVTESRAVFVEEAPRMLRDVSALVSRYVGNIVAPVLPAPSTAQTSILEAAGIAAVCWTALLVTTSITTHLASRRKGARLRLSGGPR
jgi:hypothetical protein